MSARGGSGRAAIRPTPLLRSRERLPIRKNSRCQRGPNHPREIGTEVRLRQQQHASVEPAMMHDGGLSITRRIKHLEPWASLQRLDRELTAVHAAWYDYVGEQQIDAFSTIDDR